MKTKKYYDIQAVMSRPFIDVDNELEKKNFKELIDSKNPEAFKSYVDGYLKNLTKAEHGRELPQGIQKFTGIGGIPSNPAQIAVFEALSNELQLDTAWMSMYEMVNVSGTSAAEIVDIDALKSTWMNYTPGDDIKLSDFGTTSYTQVKEARWGFAVGILRRWIETEQWWNVNKLMQSIMVKNQSKKATEAYSAVEALTPDVTTCAGTTLAQQVTALNSAYITLMTRLEGQGFGISATTPAYILSRATHQPTVSQILNLRTGAETVNQVVEWNIQASFTFNSNLSAIPSGKSGFYLYVPALKNKWITFDSLKTEQSSDFGTDSIKIKAQEYWNQTLNVDQFQIVDITN